MKFIEYKNQFGKILFVISILLSSVINSSNIKYPNSENKKRKFDNDLLVNEVYTKNKKTKFDNKILEIDEISSMNDFLKNHKTNKGYKFPQILKINFSTTLSLESKSVIIDLLKKFCSSYESSNTKSKVYLDLDSNYIYKEYKEIFTEYILKIENLKGIKIFCDEEIINSILKHNKKLEYLSLMSNLSVNTFNELRNLKNLKKLSLLCSGNKKLEILSKYYDFFSLLKNLEIFSFKFNSFNEFDIFNNLLCSFSKKNNPKLKKIKYNNTSTNSITFGKHLKLESEIEEKIKETINKLIENKFEKAKIEIDYKGNPFIKIQ